MKKKTLRDIQLKNKTVIHRCDFNIKLKECGQAGMAPVSDVRIKAYFPSIFYLLEKGCKIVFMSYLERPGGKVVEQLRLAPVAQRMSQLINRRVYVLEECVGSKVRKFIKQMKPGEMVMLENTRFHPGEEADDNRFAQALADNGEVMVQDAFGQCHRMHASVTGIPRYLPSVAGFYLQGEMQVFDKLMRRPSRPLVLIVGGTKIFDKVGAIRNLIDRADQVLIGGAVANNFLCAQGIDIGRSFMSEPFVDQAKGGRIDPVAIAKNLLRDYADKIFIPQDLVAADSLTEPKKTKIIDLKKKAKLPTTWSFLDIGPRTTEHYLKIIGQAKTVFWDGPMGKYEDVRFRRGTLKIAEAVAENHETTILAGGDTAALAENFGLIFRYSHVSVAGGAALEYLSGKPLPGITALLDN
ncbi:phosphoglycerate kinase [Patescibacteria group bacterium]|nr:phosphoglycerate kinase [Patescibacteria group bacterium]MBU1931542.1 phosphoglycerate kinase [Patescibacteria group bacterium]